MASAKELLKALVNHLARLRTWQLMSSSEGSVLHYREVIRVKFNERSSGKITIELEALNPKNVTNSTYMRAVRHELQQAFGVASQEVFGVRIEES